MPGKSFGQNEFDASPEEISSEGS